MVVKVKERKACQKSVSLKKKRRTQRRRGFFKKVGGVLGKIFLREEKNS